MVSVFGFSVASSLELKIATKTEKEKAYTHKKTTEAFDDFIKRIKEGQEIAPTPTLTQLIYFNVFKLLSELQKDTYKADYDFYKNKTDFLSDVKINFFKKTFAKFMAGRIIKKTMKNR